MYKNKKDNDLLLDGQRGYFPGSRYYQRRGAVDYGRVILDRNALPDPDSKIQPLSLEDMGPTGASVSHLKSSEPITDLQCRPSKIGIGFKKS